MKDINKGISGGCVLLAVSDMDKARAFYETVLGQKVLVNIDNMNVYYGGFALQAKYAELVAGGEGWTTQPTGAKLEMKTKPNNFQLGFEVEDLDYWAEKIKSVEGIEILHDIAEYVWNQRVLRFYDHDGHIIELGESIETIAKHLLAQGLSVEEVAERISHPLEFVQGLL